MVLVLAALCTAGVFFYWGAVKGPGDEGAVAPAPAELRTVPTSAPALRPAWHEARSDSARLRVVIDQVAALTDAQAVRWHAQLTGSAL